MTTLKLLNNVSCLLYVLFFNGFLQSILILFSSMPSPRITSSLLFFNWSFSMHLSSEQRILYVLLTLRTDFF